MEGLKPELTTFLREAMMRKATLNATGEDLIYSASAGLAGLVSML